MLARGPNVYTEALLMAYGFSIKFLADLVFDGLATAEPSTMRAHGLSSVVISVNHKCVPTSKAPSIDEKG
jgi:hypothetical protein